LNGSGNFSKRKRLIINITKNMPTL
jgi:hypothetical protein